MIEKRGWRDRPTTVAAAIPRPHSQAVYTIIAGLLAIALLLISCSGTAQQTTSPVSLSTNYTGALTVENQLAAGSLMLEETDLAIDSAQAPELLTLWQAFRSLSGSDTSAQQEIDAVINQIEETMSTEQLGAIRAMQLTSDDLASILQQYAVPSMASADSGSGDSPSAAFGPGPDGFVAGGGAGPGGGDGMAFLGPSAGQGTILSAASTESPAQSLTTTGRYDDRSTFRLVDSLITLLEAKSDA
jgi:hypothetical protein